MSYQRFKALTELIKRYRSYDESKYTIVICGFGTLSELRLKCVKALFETREDKQEYFYGSRIILDTEISYDYLAVAYSDKVSGEISRLTEIKEEAVTNDSK